MCFSVTSITAVANLVDADQVTDANGRLQASFAGASIIGPVLAGVLAARFGPAAALGVDALSFAVSALSLTGLRLRSATARRPDAPHERRVTELLAGVTFLWRQPVLRALTYMIAGFSFLTLGALDLFVYHLKHDLGQNDRAVGLVFSIASTGAIAGGLLAAPVRRRWGFGVCYLGSAIVEGVVLAGIGLAPAVAVMVPLVAGFTFLEILKGVNSIALRQQVTPDHLLGRVTAAFWTINSAPGPIGAALLTALAATFGAPAMLMTIGALFTAIALLGLRSPAHERCPEARWRPSGGVDRDSA
jgi:Na+/melibiose symporter-like transporter